MNKQEPSESLLQGNVERKNMRKGRYYVQSLTQYVFVVREYLSVEGEPGPDDRIVRSFDIRHDASRYTDSLNDGHQA